MREAVQNSAPIGSLLRAREYLDAASLVQRPAQNEHEEFVQNLSIPAYYLVGHAIELALKAFLLERGITVGELRSRKYGHNLDALVLEARRRRLGMCVKLSHKEVSAISMLNVCYSAKEFEYRAGGARRPPYYSLVHGIAVRLCEGIEPYCVKLLR